MRAIAVRAFKAAPEIVDIPNPRPQGDEILVAISVAGVNPFDWRIADGMLDGQMPHTFPLVLGFDGAGTVKQVGPSVQRFKAGDKVYGQFWQSPLGKGTYAEYVAISEKAPIALIPTGLTMAQAAALPTAGMAAAGLLEKLALSQGQTVAIVGATGGVGLFLTQLARDQGLRVLATGTPADGTNLRSLGAESVIDYTRGERPPQGIDGLVDLVSDAAHFAAYAGAVKAGGAAVTSNFVADEDALRKRGVRGGNFTVGASSAALERLGQACVDGRLQVQIQQQVNFADALGALAASRAGLARGKTVISV